MAEGGDTEPTTDGVYVLVGVNPPSKASRNCGAQVDLYHM